jgi:hypothetical protein
MAQFARPSSDVTDGSWLTDAGSSVLYAAIDEASASDTDYIYSPDNTNTTCEIALSSVTDPTSSTGHIVRYRYARSDESASPIAAASGGSTSSVQVFLYQGATLIATGTSRNTFDGAWAADSFTLSGTEADNITNYADLRVQITATGGGGSPANRRGVAVSWAELEVPDAAVIPQSLLMILLPSLY